MRVCLYLAAVGGLFVLGCGRSDSAATSESSTEAGAASVSVPAPMPLPASPARVPGGVPVDFPVVDTKAQAGERAIAVMGGHLERLWNEGAGTVPVSLVDSTIVTPGAGESTLSSQHGESAIPNSLFIPLPKGARAKKGDVVLAATGPGRPMSRGWVTGGSETEPEVSFFAEDYDGKVETGTLTADSFVVLTDSNAPGTTVFFDGKTGTEAAWILALAGDRVLAVDYNGMLIVLPRKGLITLHPRPDLKVGAKVRAVHIAGVVEGTVMSVDLERGRAGVAFRRFGKELKHEVPLSDVLPL